MLTMITITANAYCTIIMIRQYFMSLISFNCYDNSVIFFSPHTSDEVK